MRKFLNVAVITWCLLFIQGCSYYVQPKITERQVTLRVVDRFPDEPFKYGETKCFHDNTCVLTIRRDVYPNCFVHEIRHAMEGMWHGERDNSMYCKPSTHPNRPTTQAEYDRKEAGELKWKDIYWENIK